MYSSICRPVRIVYKPLRNATDIAVPELGLLLTTDATISAGGFRIQSNIIGEDRNCRVNSDCNSGKMHSLSLNDTHYTLYSPGSPDFYCYDTTQSWKVSKKLEDFAVELV